MLKFSKSMLIVALVLFATSAMASNFRCADQVYVPAAGKIAGFVSDVYISNCSDDAVAISVIFQGGQSGGAGEEFKNLFVLQPRERKQLLDFIGAAQPNGLGKTGVLGQLIFNACRQGQDCGPATQVNGISPNFRNVSVETRIYSTAANGSDRYSSAVCTAAGSSPATQPTNGQLFPGFPWYSYVSRDAQTVGLDSVFITGIRQGDGPGTYRSNIGIVNASQFSSTEIRLRLFQGTNTTAVTENRTTLGPLGQLQRNFTQIFPGQTGDNFYVVADQTAVTPTSPSDPLCADGCPGFFAYGSQLDNATGDATTLESQFLGPLTEAALGCIYSPTANCKASPQLRRSVRH